ncbi:CHAT domain-containing protein, partial [Angustibacter aerolatus]
RHGGARLDTLLLAPLRQRLDGHRDVVLVPTDTLHAVPWSLLPSLADRDLHVAPSGSAWARAAARPAPSGPDVYAAGPGLEHADDEVTALHAIGGGVLLRGPAATAGAVREVMEGARLVHVAAHGSFDDDSPMLSSLHLADGPLNVYDLEGLAQPPGTVVLAACHSAVARVHPGDELLGVADTLLRLGTRTVVATSIPTPDAETAVLVQAFHAGLRAGRAPAPALRLARAQLDHDEPAALATAAGFGVFGA